MQSYSKSDKLGRPAYYSSINCAVSLVPWQALPIFLSVKKVGGPGDEATVTSLLCMCLSFCLFDLIVREVNPPRGAFPVLGCS